MCDLIEPFDGTSPALDRPVDPLPRNTPTEPARKLTAAEKRWEDWAAEHPAEAKMLTDTSEWSSFSRDISDAIRSPRGITPNQFRAVQNMTVKVQAREAAKAQEKAAAASVVLDLSPIRDMFTKAHASGYKTPTYRADGLVIKAASAKGRNPGALYVTDEAKTYLGKLVGVTFHPVTGKGATVDVLAGIAKDPLNAAIRYGRKTGNCACCGRELTNRESVELGIGPICREKWGL